MSRHSILQEAAEVAEEMNLPLIARIDADLFGCCVRWLVQPGTRNFDFGPQKHTKEGGSRLPANEREYARIRSQHTGFLHRGH